METKDPAAKPIMETQFARKETKTIEVGGAAKTDERTGDDTQMIRVRALRTFHRGENMTGELARPDDEFDLPRHRAAQLRANGLIEYADIKNAAVVHGPETAERLENQASQRAELEKMPDSAKGTPLTPPPALRTKPADEKK